MDSLTIDSFKHGRRASSLGVQARERQRAAQEVGALKKSSQCIVLHGSIHRYVPPIRNQGEVHPCNLEGNSVVSSLRERFEGDAKLRVGVEERLGVDLWGVGEGEGDALERERWMGVEVGGEMVGMEVGRGSNREIDRQRETEGDRERCMKSTAAHASQNSVQGHTFARF